MARISVSLASGSLALEVDAADLEGADAALVGDLIGRIGDHVLGDEGLAPATLTIDLSDGGGEP